MSSRSSLFSVEHKVCASDCKANVASYSWTTKFQLKVMLIRFFIFDDVIIPRYVHSGG